LGNPRPTFCTATDPSHGASQVSRPVVSPSSAARRRGAVVLTAAAALLLVLSPSAHADPDDEPSLEELNERVEALEEEYDAELVQYTSAKEEAEQAADELDEI